MSMLDSKKYYKNNGQYLLGFGLITVIMGMFILIIPSLMTMTIPFLFALGAFSIMVGLVGIILGIAFLRISKKQKQKDS